ncbi:MAG: prolipoprotein diacylglyceryl transferase [Planctomycetota bacterium]
MSTPVTPADLGGWLHDLSPIIFEVGGFAIRWYGVSYLAGFAAAYLLLRFLAKRGATAIPAERVFDVILALVVGVVVGGRLGYVLLYEPRLLGLVNGFPYWGVLAVNNGGMSSHGGIVGVILAAWKISRGAKNEHGEQVGRCPPLHAMDMCALIAPAGLLFGRIANFINGELLGRIVAGPGESAPWWSVRYPQEILSEFDRLPHSDSQLDRVIRLSNEYALGEENWFGGYERLLSAIQRGDAAAQTAVEPLLSARYPTQLMQASLDGLLVGVVVWIVSMKRRAPGVIGAWFLIVYGLGRVPMDLVRLPDAGIVQFGGLTRGQVYSGLMVIAGVILLLWVRKRGAEKLSGGWLRQVS